MSRSLITSAQLLEVLERKDHGLRLEKKRVSKPFSVKTTDTEGQIEGYGAVFGVDHPTSAWSLPFDWVDRIAAGAFKKSLAEHKRIGSTPLMLFMHERGNIHGAWRTVEEDKDGLFVVGNVAPSAISPSGVPTLELLRMGALTGLSIGFRVTKATLDEDEKRREILEVELAEISIVDIPGGPTARITDVKAADPHNIQFLETVLRDAGLSRKEAKALLADGFKALRDAEPNDGPTQRDADRPPPPAASAANTNPGNDELADLLRGFAQAIRPQGEE